MDTSYMLACGIVWRKAADPEAGWELVEALKSADPELRALAQTLLLENREESMRLLECALASGAVSPEAAGPCMVEIVRGKFAVNSAGTPRKPTLFDTSLC